jgi:hypothetical protein
MVGMKCSSDIRLYRTGIPVRPAYPRFVDSSDGIRATAHLSGRHTTFGSSRIASACIPERSWIHQTEGANAVCSGITVAVIDAASAPVLDAAIRFFSYAVVVERVSTIATRPDIFAAVQASAVRISGMVASGLVFVGHFRPRHAAKLCGHCCPFRFLLIFRAIFLFIELRCQ